MYWRIYTAYQFIAFFGLVFSLVHWINVRVRISGWFSLLFLFMFLTLTWVSMTLSVFGTLAAYLLPNSRVGMVLPTILLAAPWVYYVRTYLAARPARPARKRK